MISTQRRTHGEGRAPGPLTPVCFRANNAAFSFAIDSEGNASGGAEGQVVLAAPPFGSGTMHLDLNLPGGAGLAGCHLGLTFLALAPFTQHAGR